MFCHDIRECYNENHIMCYPTLSWIPTIVTLWFCQRVVVPMRTPGPGGQAENPRNDVPDIPDPKDHS